MVDQISKEGWFPSASGTLAADKTKLELVLHFLKVRLILKSIYQLMQYCANSLPTSSAWRLGACSVWQLKTPWPLSDTKTTTLMKTPGLPCKL